MADCIRKLSKIIQNCLKTSCFFISDHEYSFTACSRIPTNAKFNKGSVQRQREVELNADAVPEGMDTCEPSV
ncbi:unnamed protein product [Trichobilharzia regenti]|nr:unnamed protein product [Trichobilharzia regenti]